MNQYKPRCYKPKEGERFQIFWRLKESANKAKVWDDTWQHFEYAASIEERRTILANAREDNPLYEFHSAEFAPKWWPNSVGTVRSLPAMV